MKKFILILLVGVGITVLLLNFMNTGEINIDDFDKIKNSEYQSEVTFLAMIEKAKEEEQKPVGVSGLPNYSKSPNYVHLTGWEYPAPLLLPFTIDSAYPDRAYTGESNYKWEGFLKNKHHGVDFNQADDANIAYPVLSISEGIVVRAGNGGSAGNWVMVKNTNPDKSEKIQYFVYMHMRNNSITVRKDDKVYPGDMLGIIGNTGNSEGAHLHLAARAAELADPPVTILTSDFVDYSFYKENGFANKEIFAYDIERLIGHRSKYRELIKSSDIKYVPYTNYEYHKVSEATKDSK